LRENQPSQNAPLNMEISPMKADQALQCALKQIFGTLGMFDLVESTNYESDILNIRVEKGVQNKVLAALTAFSSDPSDCSHIYRFEI
ncbi:MAG: hypothetical protein MHPSP_004182, partial [Paramarteilia canceri]